MFRTTLTKHSTKVNAHVFVGAPNSRQFSSYRIISVMQNENHCHETLWNPINFFERPPNYKYAVIVLNRPIEMKRSIILPLWQQAQVTITVDGGTDRWLDYLGDLAAAVCAGECSTYVPTMITGDMDSIHPLTQEMFEKMGVKVIKTPDQNHTDYTKALMELTRHCKSQDLKLNGIYVIAESSGRFDHIIGNVNTLFKSVEFLEGTEVIQVASNSLTWILRPGNHRITIPESLVRQRSWCGLLPIGSQIENVTTSGLEWNLNNGTMNFGGMVSTSNTYNEESKEVTIVINDKLIWTMGIEPLVKNWENS